MSQSTVYVLRVQFMFHRVQFNVPRVQFMSHGVPVYVSQSTVYDHRIRYISSDCSESQFMSAEYRFCPQFMYVLVYLQFMS